MYWGPGPFISGQTYLFHIVEDVSLYPVNISNPQKMLGVVSRFRDQKISVGNKSTWFFIWVYILLPLVFGYETVDNSTQWETMFSTRITQHCSTGPKEERKRGCAIRSCSALSEARLKLGRDRAMKGGTLCRVKTRFLAMKNTHVDWLLWVLDDIKGEQT